MNRFQFRIYRGCLNSIPAISIQSVVLLLAFFVQPSSPYNVIQIDEFKSLMYLFGYLLTIFTLASFIQGYIKSGN